MARALLPLLALSGIAAGNFGGAVEVEPPRFSGGPYRDPEPPRAPSTRDPRPFRRSLDERKKRRAKKQARAATRRAR